MNACIKILIAYLLFIVPVNAYSQTSEIDSLIVLEKIAKQEDKLPLLLEITEKFYYTDVQSSMQWAQKTHDLAVGLNDDYHKGMSRHFIAAYYINNGEAKKAISIRKQAINDFKKANRLDKVARQNLNIGNNYTDLGELDSTLYYFNKALDYAIKNDDQALVSGSYLNLSTIYHLRGDKKTELEYMLKALNYAEKNNDKDQLLVLYPNLAAYYSSQGKFGIAKNYLLTAITLSQDMGRTNNEGDAYNNLSAIYNNNNEVDSALFFLNKAKTIFEQTKNSSSLALNLQNQAGIKSRKSQHYEALELLLKSYVLWEELNDKYSMSRVLGHMAAEYINIKNYRKSVEKYQQAIKLANELKLQQDLVNYYGEMADVLAEMGNFKEAFDAQFMHQTLKDSLISLQSQKELNELETKYETEKKELEIVKLQAEQTAKDEIIEKEKTLKYVLYSGIGLVLLFALFLFNRIKVTQKQKQVIEKQKEEVDNQRKIAEEKTEIVSEKNKEITDSINYAKRIQDAILPAKDRMKEILPDSFVFFKPKDIVSGDFYWMESVNGKSLFAAVDCTGHGVPGALMSVVGHNGLTKATNERSYDSPADILKVLNQTVSKTLQAHKNEVKDGMDISICSMDFKTHKLEFAAAMNPLYYIHNNELIEIKGDKQAIGGKVEGVEYANHTLQLQKGDTVYLFTDGFADQFGGVKGKKYKYKPFKELLLSIQHKTMEEQHAVLSKEFDDWKGELEQIDDVCIIGVRV